MIHYGAIHYGAIDYGAIHYGAIYYRAIHDEAIHYEESAVDHIIPEVKYIDRRYAAVDLANR